MKTFSPLKKLGKKGNAFALQMATLTETVLSEVLLYDYF